MNSLTLEIEVSASGKSQTIVLHGDNVDKIKVEMETNTTKADPETLDGPLCSVIFYAMRHGRDLKVSGEISEKLFRNIRTFQEAWHCHYPSLYHEVDIVPTRVTPRVQLAVPTSVGAIQTFSGGVDSLFSLLRNKGRGNIAVPSTNTILLVHGFDIPHSNKADFDALCRRVQSLADTCEVELHVLKTTLRDSLQIDWEHSHGAAIAGALHNYSNTHPFGVIASSDPYNYVSFVPQAWGTNPATDYLLSGSQMEILHDGAGYARPQKVAFLAKTVPSLLRDAQFCWEGKVRSENCGVCDKCIHTRLSLRASGNSEDICFKSKFHMKMIDAIRFGEETLGDILPLLDLALANNCTEPWVDEIQERIAPFLPVMYKSNRSVAKSLRYLRAAVRELRL